MTLVAREIIDDRAIELTFPANPDGKYLLKGGTRAVWDEFQLPRKWRSKLGEGLIEGKRCGVTPNIGPAARQRRSALPDPHSLPPSFFHVDLANEGCPLMRSSPVI